RRLAHDRAERKSADQPVATRKVERARRRPAGELRDERPLRHDLGRQARVPGRIDAVDPGAEHGDRASARGERAAVRGRVDTGGEAAHDRDARLRQPARQLVRDAPAVLTRPPGADDGNRRLVRGESAPHREREWRIGDVPQTHRILGVWPGDEARTGALERRDLALGAYLADRGDDRGAEPGGEEVPVTGVQDRAGRAEALDERERASWRQRLDEGKRQPRKPLAVCGETHSSHTSKHPGYYRDRSVANQGTFSRRRGRERSATKCRISYRTLTEGEGTVSGFFLRGRCPLALPARAHATASARDERTRDFRGARMPTGRSSRYRWPVRVRPSP